MTRYLDAVENLRGLVPAGQASAAPCGDRQVVTQAEGVVLLDVPAFRLLCRDLHAGEQQLFQPLHKYKAGRLPKSPSEKENSTI